MPGDITFDCNTIELAERGGYTYLALQEKVSWLYLLESYSGKKLTHPEDRLTLYQESLPKCKSLDKTNSSLNMVSGRTKSLIKSFG